MSWDRARRIAMTGSAFLLFFSYGALLAWAVMPLARLSGGTPGERSRRCRRILGGAWRFFHWYMRLVNVVRYDPRAAALELPAPPFVLVANHPTLIDVTAIVATYPDLAIVAKRAMFRSPLVGRILKSCDFIDAGDGSIFAGVAVIDQAIERLRAGVSVLVFPEGTRSPERGLGRFHPGAVEIAARAGVPLVPLFLRCEPPTLKRGAPWYAIPPRPADLTVTALPALAPPYSEPKRTLEDLRDEYLRRIAADPARTGAPEAAARAPEGGVALN
jgi:1-acyl-sn-glycerol-3-phosphate acyltransferase